MLVDDALLQEVRESAPEHTVSIREHADTLYTRVSRQEIYVETQLISWPERIHQQLLVAVDRLATFRCKIQASEPNLTRAPAGDF